MHETNSVRKVEIFLFGGLGNQLFQLSKALSMRVNNQDLNISLNFGLNYDRDNICNLLDLTSFDIKYRLKKFPRLQHSLLKRKLNPFYKYEYSNCKANDIYRKRLYGYFQDYRIVLPVISSIEAIFEKSLGITENATRAEIQGKSIGLHIRQGDYVSNNVYTNLKYDYYYAALTEIVNHWNKNIDELRIFSDSSLDSNPITEQIARDFPDLKISLRISDGKSDILDLIEMSREKYLICANSTFSWWAAALNADRKVFIARPKRYFLNGETPSFLYPDEWWSC